MRIGILGTRGIPNFYGGFEQFAEYLSVGLVKKGCEVYVYNSENHPFREKTYKGVQLITCKDLENKIGTAGQFYYDFNCILDARKRDFDIIFQLGYTSSSIFFRFLPSKPLVVTNMDGLEWKRSKFNKAVQFFLRYAEKLAIKSSDVLVSDSIGIKAYLFAKYDVDSNYIAYGAHAVKQVDIDFLKEYQVTPQNYSLLIARFEPENSLEIILDGIHAAKSEHPFLVVGKYKTDYGTYLREKYKSNKRIIFTGPIYDIDILNALRWHSRLYFHGHQVGGTNPSLLEAMASKALIAAHKNPFNRAVLAEKAFYFVNENEVKQLAETTNESLQEVQHWREENWNKIIEDYSWESIIDKYHSLFKKHLKEKVIVKPNA
ncbi:MAG: DUF1972 domain-containing protein [Luteibaculaceae bacterium]